MISSLSAHSCLPQMQPQPGLLLPRQCTRSPFLPAVPGAVPAGAGQSFGTCGHGISKHGEDSRREGQLLPPRGILPKGRARGGGRGRNDPPARLRKPSSPQLQPQMPSLPLPFSPFSAVMAGEGAVQQRRPKPRFPPMLHGRGLTCVALGVASSRRHGSPPLKAPRPLWGARGARREVCSSPPPKPRQARACRSLPLARQGINQQLREDCGQSASPTPFSSDRPPTAFCWFLWQLGNAQRILPPAREHRRSPLQPRACSRPLPPVFLCARPGVQNSSPGTRGASRRERSRARAARRARPARHASPLSPPLFPTRAYDTCEASPSDM